MADQHYVKTLTPEFKVSYPHVFSKNETSGKYEVTALFMKGVDMIPMIKEMNRVILARYGSKENIPPKFRRPFRKPSEKDEYSELDMQCFMTLKSKKRRPGIVASDGRTPVENEADFYGGCYAKATVNCKIYEPTPGGKQFTPGCAFYLQNLQKVRDDEPFGGGFSNAEDDFEPLEGSSEDAGSYEEEPDLFG